MSINELFGKELKVINTGLSSFAENLKHSGVPTVQMDWKPPVNVDPKYFNIIESKSEEIANANRKATDIILKGMPVLTGLDIALNVIPGMKKNLILHSGPPITWDRMCGPTKGAIMGALIYEGFAKDIAEAEKIASSGEIEYAPCHEHSAVGPMAGIISPSMPVFIIKNETFGNYAYCTLNEGLGKVLRYGAFREDVITRLKWMEKILYPTLKKAVDKTGSINLKNMIAQALHMGDEVHNRNRAGTSLFFRTIAPAIMRTTDNFEDAARKLFLAVPSPSDCLPIGLDPAP